MVSFCRKPNFYDYANNEIAILRDTFIYHINQAMTNAEQIKTVKESDKTADQHNLINTVFDLITAHTPISAQSSNSVVFRLQPVYFLSTSL